MSWRHRGSHHLDFAGLDPRVSGSRRNVGSFSILGVIARERGDPVTAVIAVIDVVHGE